MTSLFLCHGVVEVKRVFVKEDFYKSLGFAIIPNYGQYKEMKESICMEKNLT